MCTQFLVPIAYSPVPLDCSGTGLSLAGPRQVSRAGRRRSRILPDRSRRQAIAILISRTLIRTWAPISSGLRRIMPQVASANCVWARPRVCTGGRTPSHRFTAAAGWRAWWPRRYARPAARRRPHEVLEASCRTAGPETPQRCGQQLRLDRGVQMLVARHLLDRGRLILPPIHMPAVSRLACALAAVQCLMASWSARVGV